MESEIEKILYFVFFKEWVNKNIIVFWYEWFSRVGKLWIFKIEGKIVRDVIEWGEEK